MSTHEGRSSFVSRYYQRFRTFCRRLSRPSYTTEVLFGRNDSNQQNVLETLIDDALPALPTQDQLQQAGGRVLYRQRDPDEYELTILPPGLQNQMQTSMQVILFTDLAIYCCQLEHTAELKHPTFHVNRFHIRVRKRIHVCGSVQAGAC